MELIQLRYYVTIAEVMSFTSAAQLLHVSQPALSYQIKRLEEELGTRLFNRGGRKITLTSDGELFLPLAQAVLLRANEAFRVLRERQGAEVGEVRMGCNPSVATYLVPGPLAAFRRDHPLVRVEILEGGDLDLQQSVQQGSIDFAILTAPGSPQTLDVVPLGSESLFLIAPPGHPVAAHESVDLASLAHEEFIFAGNAFNVTSQTIEACRRAGFEPKVTYRAASLETVKNLVRQGLGLSLMPQIALEGSGSQNLVVVGVKGGLSRELNLISGKDRAITRAAEALMAQLRSSLTVYLRQPPPNQAVTARDA